MYLKIRTCDPRVQTAISWYTSSNCCDGWADQYTSLACVYCVRVLVYIYIYIANINTTGHTRKVKIFFHFKYRFYCVTVIPTYPPTQQPTYLPTYPTNPAKQRTSWETISSSASQEIPRILRNPNAYHLTHKRPPPVPFPSHTNPIHACHPTS